LCPLLPGLPTGGKEEILMVRLYFNRHGQRPWSVDNGPGTPEQTFKEVRLKAQGRVVYRPLAFGEDPAEVPQAWVEFGPEAHAMMELGKDDVCEIFDL
jgi:hypothetical protein